MGMLECSVPTFLFLPHCPKQLSNNLLYSNWSSTALGNLVICSNSFTNIVERNAAKVLAESASYIVAVIDNNLVNELPLSNSFKLLMCSMISHFILFMHPIQYLLTFGYLLNLF